MSNNFSIVISATDRATATIKKINDSVSRFTRPLQEVKKASAALGKELGIDKMGKSLAKVGQAASDVAEKIGRVIAPLAAVVGVGSIAAIGELATKWGNVGAEIGRTSITLGMSTKDLQLWRGAAELAGVSAESMTGGIKSLGDTLQDAVMGRNQQALGVMNQIGFSMKRTATGAVDVNAALMDMSRVIARYEGQPQKQGVLARMFGLEALLPLLREGPEAIKRYMAQVAKTGIMSKSAIAAAKEFYEKLGNLKQSFGNLKNTIGNDLLPILQTYVDKMTAWLGIHKQAISEEFSKMVKGIGKAFGEIDWSSAIKGVENFGSAINVTVQAIGGWNTVMKGFEIYIGALVVLKIFSVTKAIWDLAAAFGGLTLVALTTPFGWIILSIGLLEIAGIALVAKWDRIKLWWKHLWGGMSDDAYKSALKILDAKKMLNPAQKAADWSKAQSVSIPVTQGVNSPATPAMEKARAEGDISQLMKRGWTRAQAIGISANIQRESSGDEKKIGDHGAAYGLAQWHPDRQANFAQWAGKDIRQSTREEQIDFLDHELRRGSETSAGALLSKATDAGRAAAIISKKFERPADVTGEAMIRSRMALSQTGPAVETPYSVQAPYGINPNMAKTGAIVNPAMAQNGQGAGAVTVLISFENAPKGMKTKTQTSGGIIANTKIRYAMPEFGVT
jgi:hypothetical protein